MDVLERLHDIDQLADGRTRAEPPHRDDLGLELPRAPERALDVRRAVEPLLAHVLHREHGRGGGRGSRGGRGGAAAAALRWCEAAARLDDRELALAELVQQLVVLEARALERERLLVGLERWESMERVPQWLQDLPRRSEGGRTPRTERILSGVESPDNPCARHGGWKESEQESLKSVPSHYHTQLSYATMAPNAP